MSCRAPGKAGKAGKAGKDQISHPAGSARTCTFTPWRLCSPHRAGQRLRTPGEQGELLLLHSDGTIERSPRDLDWPGAMTAQRSCASSDS